MKLTQSQLRKLIKEELEAVMNEQLTTLDDFQSHIAANLKFDYKPEEWGALSDEQIEAAIKKHIEGYKHDIKRPKIAAALRAPESTQAVRNFIKSRGRQ